jgi:hypothetical protein
MRWSLCGTAGSAEIKAVQSLALRSSNSGTALVRLVPVLMPDFLFRLPPNGEPLFKEFAVAMQLTDFSPGRSFGT